MRVCVPILARTRMTIPPGKNVLTCIYGECAGALSTFSRYPHIVGMVPLRAQIVGAARSVAGIEPRPLELSDCWGCRAMHGKCRRINERLDEVVAMKIEDLRHGHTEHGRWCGSRWRSLCIICSSMRFAKVRSLQCLEKEVWSRTDSRSGILTSARFVNERLVRATPHRVRVSAGHPCNCIRASSPAYPWRGRLRPADRGRMLSISQSILLIGLEGN